MEEKVVSLMDAFFSTSEVLNLLFSQAVQQLCNDMKNGTFLDGVSEKIIFSTVKKHEKKTGKKYRIVKRESKLGVLLFIERKYTTEEEDEGEETLIYFLWGLRKDWKYQRLFIDL